MQVEDRAVESNKTLGRLQKDVDRIEGLSTFGAEMLLFVIKLTVPSSCGQLLLGLTVLTIPAPATCLI